MEACLITRKMLGKTLQAVCRCGWSGLVHDGPGSYEAMMKEIRQHKQKAPNEGG